MTSVSESRTAGVTGPAAGHPSVSMTLGALFVSASAVLIHLSGTSPGTASFFRCLLALPVLVPLALLERGREGPMPARRRAVTLAAGALFAGDMLLWTAAISEVGAGLSTVLVNVQVVIVPLLALLVDREPPPRRFVVSLPFLLLGVVLASGVAEGGAGGSRPLLGTVHAVLAAVCYSGFLFLLRRGGQQGQAVQSYLWVTVAATVASLAAGALWQGVDLTPGWTAVGWLTLVALFGQVLGWLLVAVASPRLASHVGAILLLLTPVGALVLGWAVLGEHPSPLQLAGCAVILASGTFATTRSARDS
ncbi:DMT family transporter [Microbispora sp. NPDC046973]|uniref:DMT family transporter n=1 Tax=Microbispora sp. NPDC046973 TaxID=3155022 RepID=UPI0033C3816D